MKSLQQLKIALLAAAISTAFAAPAAAQTGITVMGLVDVFAGSVRDAGDANSTSVLGNGGMTTSWFGVKGSEDLGGGLKAHFLLTSFIQADTGASGRYPGDPLFSRDANVGLSGGFGAVSFGRELSPHFLPTILFSPFGDSYTFSPLLRQTDMPTGAWAPLIGDTGWSNSIRYTTPDMGGLKVNLHYQFGEAAGNTGRNNIGANALYFAGPLALTAYYHKVETSQNPPTGFGFVPAGTNQKSWMIGGSYELKMAKLFATYGATTHDVDYDNTTLSLGASIPCGPGKFLASWARSKREGTAFGADLTRNTTSIGYDYGLSVRTDLYAVYMNDRVTNRNSGNSVGVGLRHRF
jgi:predicted porin